MSFWTIGRRIHATEGGNEGPANEVRWFLYRFSGAGIEPEGVTVVCSWRIRQVEAAK